MKQKILNVDLKVNLDELINFSQSVFQKKELKKLCEELAKVSGYLWDRRWAERTAGNISVNITSFYTAKDLAAKAAGIYLSCTHTGFEPEGLTNTEITELKQHYGI